MKQCLIDLGERIMFFAQDMGEKGETWLPNRNLWWRFWFWVERKADKFQNWALRTKLMK